MTNEVNLQIAPYPVELKGMVNKLKYKPGWSFQLIECNRDEVDGVIVGKGLTLIITTRGYNSYHPEQGQNYGVNHYMIVPAATYDYRSWRRWLFEQIALVERHEAAEFFDIDGERPYAPSHGPGNDPYMLREIGTELDQKTSFRGTVNP